MSDRPISSCGFIRSSFFLLWRVSRDRQHCQAGLGKWQTRLYRRCTRATATEPSCPHPEAQPACYAGVAHSGAVGGILLPDRFHVPAFHAGFRSSRVARNITSSAAHLQGVASLRIDGGSLTRSGEAGEGVPGRVSSSQRDQLQGKADPFPPLPWQVRGGGLPIRARRLGPAGAGRSVVSGEIGRGAGGGGGRSQQHGPTRPNSRP